MDTTLPTASSTSISSAAASPCRGALWVWPSASATRRRMMQSTSGLSTSARLTLPVTATECSMSRTPRSRGRDCDQNIPASMKPRSFLSRMVTSGFTPGSWSSAPRSASTSMARARPRSSSTSSVTVSMDRLASGSAKAREGTSPTSALVAGLSSFVTGHDEQRRAVELIDRPQPLGVVVLGYVHDLFLRGHARDRDAVVKPAVNADQSSILLPAYEIERQVAKRHRHDRIKRIRIAGAHQVAEALVHDVDAPAVVVLGGRFLEGRPDDVADPAQLAVSEHVGLFAFVAHPLVRGQARALGYQHDRVAARILVAVVSEQFCEVFDLDSVLGDHAPIGGACHRRQQRGEAGVAAEDLDHEKALVRTRRRAQAVRELDRPRHAGAEADAVVGPEDVVVHRLRNGDDIHALVVQPFAVAERVVAPDRNQDVDADVLEILEHIFGDVVDLLLIAGEVWGQPGVRQMTRPHARRMEEGAARAAGAVDDRLGQFEDVVAVVRLGI